MCAVTAVDSGKREANVHMIITDYRMPEMTGYELLKKVNVALRTLVVVLTEQEEGGDRAARPCHRRQWPGVWLHYDEGLPVGAGEHFKKNTTAYENDVRGGDNDGD